MRRAVRLVLVAVALGGLVFLFVLPTRTWLAQSRGMSQAERRASVLAQENKALAARAAELQDPSYVERIARSQYGLVMPGQESYSIVLPAATTTTTVASAGGR